MTAAKESPPPIAARRPGCRAAVVGAGLAGILLIAVVTAFCVRLPVVGSGVRYREAYAALLPGQPALPPDSADLRRLLQVESEIGEAPPPPGLLTAPRRHRPGTLARLRFETFGGGGEPAANWEVRALLPPLPDARDVEVEQGPLGPSECPPPCRERIGRARAVLLEHSGDPGIPYEWVLRMPVGQAFDHSPRALTTHDILDPAPRRLESHAPLRVTLVEVCDADLRVGTYTSLDYFPHAILPIPRGLRTVHWVELAGCPSMQQPAEVSELAPAIVSSTPPTTPSPRPVATPAPATRAATAHRDPRTGRATLRVDERWLESHGQAVLFRLISICRYSALEDRWTRVPPTVASVEYRIDPLGPKDDRSQPRVIVELPDEAGLFWVRWMEAKPYRERTALLDSGRVLCNDVNLGPAPEGRLAACVPGDDRAKALFVPTPPAACEG